MWIRVRGRCQARACGLGEGVPCVHMVAHGPAAAPPVPLRTLSLGASGSFWQQLCCKQRAWGHVHPSPSPSPGSPIQRYYLAAPRSGSQQTRERVPLCPGTTATEQACYSHRGSFSHEPRLAPLGRKTDTWTRVRPPAAALVEARRPRRKGAWARTRFMVVRAQDEAGPRAQWAAPPCPVGRSPSGSCCVTRHWQPRARSLSACKSGGALPEPSPQPSPALCPSVGGSWHHH